MMNHFFKTLLLTIFTFVCQANLVSADRIKDLTSLAGIRSNQLVGYGVVVGLAGSGDGNTGITLQSMQSLVSRFGITSGLDGFNGDNAAAVMITADLPPFTKPGQSIDVTVSTVGGATSLKGGTLLMSPLLGADGETYAIAQGNVVVGGLGVEGGDNSSLTVNIPTVGRIPRGASVERLVPTEFLSTDFVILNLHKGDFSTANNIANAVDSVFGPGSAIPLDTNSIRVRAPEDPTQKVAFVSVLENIEVKLTVEVGSSQLKIRDLLRLNEGSVVELERLAGDPLDILANGVQIARGEVVMVGERFGVRFTEVSNPEDTVKKL